MSSKWHIELNAQDWIPLKSVMGQNEQELNIESRPAQPYGLRAHATCCIESNKTMCQALLINFLHWYPAGLSFNPMMHSSECTIPWRYMAYVLEFVCGVINRWRKWGERDGLRDVWEVSGLRYVPEKQHIFLIEVFYSHMVLGEVQKNIRSSS